VDGEQLSAGKIHFIHDGSIIRFEDPPNFVGKMIIPIIIDALAERQEVISLSIKDRKASKFSTDFKFEANGW